MEIFLMNMGPENRLILKNQLAVMTTLKAIEYMLATRSTSSTYDTWEHRLNPRIAETKRALDIPHGTEKK